MPKEGERASLVIHSGGDDWKGFPQSTEEGRISKLTLAKLTHGLATRNSVSQI